jgi:hypothetical protein
MHTALKSFRQFFPTFASMISSTLSPTVEPTMFPMMSPGLLSPTIAFDEVVSGGGVVSDLLSPTMGSPTMLSPTGASGLLPLALLSLTSSLRRCLRLAASGVVVSDE